MEDRIPDPIAPVSRTPLPSHHAAPPPGRSRLLRLVVRPLQGPHHEAKKSTTTWGRSGVVGGQGRPRHGRNRVGDAVFQEDPAAQPSGSRTQTTQTNRRYWCQMEHIQRATAGRQALLRREVNLKQAEAVSDEDSLSASVIMLPAQTWLAPSHPKERIHS